MTRVLLYAQVPPPVHGQSVMVGHLMDGLRKTGQLDLTAATTPAASASIAYVHVNPQISEDLGDIGRWRPGKIFRVFGFILAAIRAKFRYGLDTFYFVPAPPKREGLYRDWVVLFLCRPFFRRLILHWHCIGQPEFLEKKLSAPERWLTRLCYGRAAVSIALSKYSEKEAGYFHPKKSVIVPNGVPEPCSHFDDEAWPERQKRWEVRELACDGQVSHPFYYEVLFLAGRMTPKGLFDALAAVTRANAALIGKDSKIRMRLTVAGPFEDDDERARFEAAAKALDAAQIAGGNEPLCVYAGWADDEKKEALYREADCFLFPTTYPAESFGLVLAEAMAHGCAVITTRWQAVPEVLPPGDPNVVEPHDIEAMTEALLRCLVTPPDRSLRDYFLAHFTSERFVRDMVRVLGSA
jgi:glycosyltransferase involved in cell wall biosynthesis